MLQRGAAGVEGVGEVVVQQAAEGCHVDVGEATQATGEVGWIVAGAENAAKLRVEQVLCHSSEEGNIAGGLLVCSYWVKAETSKYTYTCVF